MNAKRARKEHVTIEDHDNPEWTAADFARAKRPESLPPEVLAAFPKTGRGPQKAPIKKLVSVRLSPGVIEFFKRPGEKGWQARMDAALLAMAERGAAKPPQPITGVAQPAIGKKMRAAALRGPKGPRKQLASDGPGRFQPISALGGEPVAPRGATPKGAKR